MPRAVASIMVQVLLFFWFEIFHWKLMNIFFYYNIYIHFHVPISCFLLHIFPLAPLTVSTDACIVSNNHNSSHGSCNFSSPGHTCGYTMYTRWTLHRGPMYLEYIRLFQTVVVRFFIYIYI